VLVLGRLGVWEASAGRRGRSEGSPDAQLLGGPIIGSMTFSRQAHCCSGLQLRFPGGIAKSGAPRQAVVRQLVAGLAVACADA
jgi:hypothetical protein